MYKIIIHLYYYLNIRVMFHNILILLFILKNHKHIINYHRKFVNIFISNLYNQLIY